MKALQKRLRQASADAQQTHEQLNQSDARARDTKHAMAAAAQEAQQQINGLHDMNQGLIERLRVRFPEHAECQSCVTPSS